MDCMASLIDSSTKCSEYIIINMLVFYIMLSDHLWEKFFGHVMSDHAGFDKYEGNHEDAEDVV